MKKKASKLSSKQKGEISENRIAEIITLASDGHLSCFRPLTDDDGLDLIVCPKGQFKPLFLQIKSRFTVQKRGRFQHNVGFNTFSPNKNFYVLFMLFDAKALQIQAMWLVPSIDFEKKATKIRLNGDHPCYRINASPKETSNDKWAEYRTDGTNLVGLINAAIAEADKL